MNLPGTKSRRLLKKIERINGGYTKVFPFIQSNKGKGAYFYDVDKNKFLDFASQVCTNPLGYNHPNLLRVLKEFKTTPTKVAGQDFIFEEHINLLEELISITPKKMDTGFIINSGAEAVENAIKICYRRKPGKGVCFKKDFHGRTLGALSLTSSKKVHTKNYPSIPGIVRLPFDESALEKLEKIEAPSYIMMETIQGEGGYNIAAKKLVRGVRRISKEKGYPMICDEVQSGMGRTGKWWGFQNFEVTPDVMSCAKALQVGAVMAPNSMFPEEGAISSTWGGGDLLNMRMGIEIIHTIRKQRLLNKNKKHGKYLIKRMKELGLKNVRGIGLMCAFDAENKARKNQLIAGFMKNGLITLGCGEKSIRLIPPYIITEKEIDEAIEKMKITLKKEFKFTKEEQHYFGCSEHCI